MRDGEREERRDSRALSGDSQAISGKSLDSHGVLAAIRTRDLQLRRQTSYP
jgi:hypothetical protein